MCPSLRSSEQRLAHDILFGRACSEPSRKRARSRGRRAVNEERRRSAALPLAIARSMRTEPGAVAAHDMNDGHPCSFQHRTSRHPRFVQRCTNYLSSLVATYSCAGDGIMQTPELCSAIFLVASALRVAVRSRTDARYCHPKAVPLERSARTMPVLLPYCALPLSAYPHSEEPKIVPIERRVPQTSNFARPLQQRGT